ncbi:MAG: hypothetical protein PHE43_00070 [Candidatus Nanoarchaeia archaeon]|nr:hypothetical protein [Candidatus Nanoarchaeia archaeon]
MEERQTLLIVAVVGIIGIIGMTIFSNMINGTISDYSENFAGEAVRKFSGPSGSGTNCTDTDGGKNYFVSGKVFGANENMTYEYRDDCSNTGKNVKEYFCRKDGTFDMVNYKCSRVCVNGACIRS